MHGLIGKMTAAEGKRDDLIAILLRGTKEMPGCLSYIVAKDPANATTPTFPVPWRTSAYWDGTQLTSFFTIDNGTFGNPPTAANAPTLSPSASFAINANLVNGTNTVKRQSATAVIAELTDTGRSMTAGGVAADQIDAEAGRSLEDAADESIAPGGRRFRQVDCKRCPVRLCAHRRYVRDIPREGRPPQSFRICV